MTKISIITYLGWIVELVSSLSTSQADFAFFTVAMVLTPSGLNAIDEICTSLFQYINLLKNEKYKFIYLIFFIHCRILIH
jgi:secreted Zn-dependent insulinase-like peptidase